MIYAKLRGGKPLFAPHVVKWHEQTVINPAAEKLLELGYKPVRDSAPEGDAPEPYVWTEQWSETESEILRSWVLTERPPEEELDPAQALEILLGGESV